MCEVPVVGGLPADDLLGGGLRARGQALAAELARRLDDDDQVEVAAQCGSRHVRALDDDDARGADLRLVLAEAVGGPVVAAEARGLAAQQRGQRLVAQALPVEREVDRLDRRQRLASAFGQRPVEVVARDDRDVVAQQRELARERALAGSAASVDADDQRGSLALGCVDRVRGALGGGEIRYRSDSGSRSR
jgi:hypothetical protein